MNKKKKKFGLLIILALVLLSGVGLYFLIKSFGSGALTLEENRWVESNKKNVVDIGVTNDIPILSYEGKGIFYDFIDYVKEDLSLNFNVVPYKLDFNSEYNYKVNITTNPSDTDLVLIKDNFVLITTDNEEYTDIASIPGIEIGILSSDKELIMSYFKGINTNIVEYDTYAELKKSLATDENVVKKGIIIPKILFTKEMIQNNYIVSYYFNGANAYYVLTLNGPSELNSILRKKYTTWKTINYEETYNKTLLSNYFEFKNISSTDQKKLQSKKYEYGFIEYGIYNVLKKSKISGFNELVLKDFNRFSGLSIKYTKYNSIGKMIEDFNSKKIDFIMNIASKNSYNEESFNTVGALDSQLIVATFVSNKDVIEDINSLKDKEVSIIRDSYLEDYLKEENIKYKSYNNISDLVKDFSSNDILIIDLENYNYYKTTAFKDSKINCFLGKHSKYNYVINASDENDSFKDLFNFYLTYNSIDELIYRNYKSIAYENVNIVYVLLLIIIALSAYLVLDFSNHIKILITRIKKNRQINLSKQDKLKYIDQLTSLKNRAYLNSKIESWDDSQVYPQAVIIVDLNNISYINDNYGREEGDKVITEAANILMQNQLRNSEIIRTDGNEFLVYLVGYEEKDIIAYLRRLNKELKTLSHGFGAASGYSIIADALKTFDDAVNEATLEMKNAKEDIK